METINRRIDFMGGHEKVLGHAFFMHVQNFQQLLRIMCHQIIPQLCETLAGDWSKMQLVFKDVLGDGGANLPQIIGHEVQTSAGILGIEREDIGDQIRYWVTPANEMTPDALRKVYQDL